MGFDQGNRGDPPPWVCTNSVIVNILRNMNYGAHTLDPITSALMHSVGVRFIDDSNFYCLLESIRSVEELYAQFQEETAVWFKLLMATGECLKSEK